MNHTTLRHVLSLTIQVSYKPGGHYNAEIESLPRVHAERLFEDTAVQACQAQALHVIAMQIETGERPPISQIAFAMADADAIGVD